jgi:hypothetical protein
VAFGSGSGLSKEREDVLGVRFAFLHDVLLSASGEQTEVAKMQT